MPQLDTNFNEMELMAGMPTPQAVAQVENVLLQFPQVDLNTTRLVHGKMCARTIFIPAGTELTGAQTNIDTLRILHGDITVPTDAGPKRLTGFHVVPANPGFKRAEKPVLTKESE